MSASSEIVLEQIHRLEKMLEQSRASGIDDITTELRLAKLRKQLLGFETLVENKQILRG
jgi:hypothetical protein